MQQAVLVDDPEAPAGVLVRQPGLAHRRAQEIGDADTGRAGAEHDDLLLLERRPGDLDRAEHRAECDGGRALDVVVVGQELVAVAIEDRPGVRSGEVLPMQARGRQLLLDRLDELIDEVEVRLTGDPLVPPAEVLRILQALRVVGPDVEDDRQGPLGADSTDERVERELPDGNAQAPRALVADAQDPLAVGDDDDVDLGIGTIAQQRGNRVTHRVGQEQPAWAPVDVAELLARQADDRRVHHGGHLLDVIEEQPVEENFVRVLERAQIDVALEVVRLSLVGLVRAYRLLIKRLHVRWQEAVQAERCPFRVRERRALVEALAVEKVHATRELAMSCHHVLLPQRSTAAPGMLRKFDRAISSILPTPPLRTTFVAASAKPATCSRLM